LEVSENDLNILARERDFENNELKIDILGFPVGKIAV